MLGKLIYVGQGERTAWRAIDTQPVTSEEGHPFGFLAAGRREMRLPSAS